MLPTDAKDKASPSLDEQNQTRIDVSSRAENDHKEEIDTPPSSFSMLSDDDYINYRPWIFWAGSIIFNAAEAFVFGSALFPMEASGEWAAFDVVSGYLVIPIKKAIEELLKNQNIIRLLRNEDPRGDGNAQIGFIRIMGKHLLAPLIPVTIAAIAMTGPKDLGHPFTHAALHTSLGYCLYAVCSALAERKWPSENLNSIKLTYWTRWIQKYILDPLLVSFPRALLVTEFFSRMDVDFVARLKKVDMVAPVVFAGSYGLYRFLRLHTQERELPRYVELEYLLAEPIFAQDDAAGTLQEQKEAQISPLNHSLEQRQASTQLLPLPYSNVETQPEEIKDFPLGCIQSVAYVAWTCFKGAAIYGGGVLGNMLYTRLLSCSNETLADHMIQDSAIALGMTTVAGTLNGIEKLYKNPSSFFCCRRTVALPSGQEQLLTNGSRIRPGLSGN